MQIIKFMILSIILFSIPTLGGSRNPNSLLSDLNSASGSYNLEKGNPQHCPDGEVTAVDNRITIGANIRITGINQEAVLENSGDRSECSTESYATFDGKKIVSKSKENCKSSAASTMEYVIEIYEGKDSEYLSVKFKKNTTLKGSHKSNFSFDCVYSRSKSQPSKLTGEEKISDLTPKGN